MIYLLNLHSFRYAVSHGQGAFYTPTSFLGVSKKNVLDILFNLKKDLLVDSSSKLHPFNIYFFYSLDTLCDVSKFLSSSKLRSYVLYRLSSFFDVKYYSGIYDGSKSLILDFDNNIFKVV